MVPDNVRTRGRDPARIYLMSHSLGCTLRITCRAPELQKVKVGGVAGAILVGHLRYAGNVGE